MPPTSTYLLLLLVAVSVSTSVSAAPIWRRSLGNLQPFLGSLGGANAPAITNDGSALPFKVDGQGFLDIQAAIKASCLSQCQQCRSLASQNSFDPTECGVQKKACLAGDNTAGANTAAATQAGGANNATTTPVPSNDTGVKTAPATQAGGASKTTTIPTKTPTPTSSPSKETGANTAPATQSGGASKTTKTPTKTPAASKETGVKTAAATQTGGASKTTTKTPTPTPSKNTGAKTAAATEAGGANNTAATPDAKGVNLQTFTGKLGAECPKVTNDGSDRPFKVEGNANFDTLRNALVRSCDVQFNMCQNVFNAQPNNAQVIKQGDCTAQQTECNKVANAAGAKTAAATQHGAGNGNGTNDQPATPTATPAATAAATQGGKGGIDPATGEKLFALPEVSEFCKGVGQTAGDGTQIKTGSCSSVVQGQIPAVEKMISSILLEPANGAELKAGDAFNVKVAVQNMATGFFDDPAKEYYTQPQTLNDQGIIKGHVHVTIQSIGDGKTPPDANVKAFFKGLNDKAQADGTLSTEVPAGTITEPGNYRICTLTGTFSHQPAIMPVAQRGAQDDCIRVTVK